MKPAHSPESRRRLGRQLFWLGLGLVLAGLALLFLARPVPLPDADTDQTPKDEKRPKNLLSR